MEDKKIHHHNTTTNNNRRNRNKRSRDSSSGGNNLLASTYSNLTVSSRKSTGRPDSPHAFFASSHSVDFVEKQNDDNEQQPPKLPQVVNQHVNGLCVVTVGDAISSWLSSQYPQHILKDIRYVVKEPPTSNASEKRKRQAKMLRGQKVDNTVVPTTTIAEMILVDNGSNNNSKEKIIPIRSCVWGTIIELNEELSPKVLLDDPLLDGYIAVVLPTGSFPPPPNRTVTK
jgi:hypothetical protein